MNRPTSLSTRLRADFRQLLATVPTLGDIAAVLASRQGKSLLRHHNVGAERALRALKGLEPASTPTSAPVDVAHHLTTATGREALNRAGITRRQANQLLLSGKGRAKLAQVLQEKVF